MDIKQEAEKYTSKEGFTAMDAVSAKYIIENLLKELEATERKLAEAEKVISKSIIDFELSESPFYKGIKSLKDYEASKGE